MYLFLRFRMCGAAQTQPLRTHVNKRVSQAPPKSNCGGKGAGAKRPRAVSIYITPNHVFAFFCRISAGTPFALALTHIIRQIAAKSTPQITNIMPEPLPAPTVKNATPE